MVKHTVEIDVSDITILTEAETLQVKEKYQYQTKWELILAVRNMRASGYTINQICNILGIGNKSVIKYSLIKDSDKQEYDQEPTHQMKKEDIRRRKEHLIAEVKALKSKGYTCSAISRELGLDRKTVTKYINIDKEYIHASTGRKFKSILDEYKSEILDLISHGINGTTIYNKIREKGYIGSDSLVRHFIANLKVSAASNKNIEHKRTEKVERKNLISLLYRSIKKIKNINPKQLSKVIEKYPDLEAVYEVVRTFKEALLSRDAKQIEDWVKIGKKLNIKELNSFISGLKRDWDAVINATVYNYSNGLAEGTVNKIKVIKRIMYGRCSFELLRNKVLLLNFN